MGGVQVELLNGESDQKKVAKRRKKKKRASGLPGDK